MSIPQRKIGETDVSAVGFGVMSLGGAYGDAGDDEGRFKVLDAALAAGYTHWDTSNLYGDTEQLLGKWFKKTGNRNKIFLATKFGFVKQDYSIRGDPEHVRECVKNSLKDLQTDYIDLFYAHRIDPKVPIEDTVEAMAAFVKSGQIKYLGLSEPSANTLRRAHATHPISVIQVEYSPFVLDIEDPKIDLLRTARELGVKIVAYSPLGRGLLTGQYKSLDDFPKDDFRRMVPKYSNENFPKSLRLADDLKAIGKAHDASGGQVALAWLLGLGDDILPIPGTKSIKYLNENIQAVNVKLTPKDMQEVRELAEEADRVEGGRYPPLLQQQLFADTPPKH